jgi:hypothetical protein
MKNYQATREKIQVYLDALKERYSNTELRSVDFKVLRQEFGVSALISTVLKQNGMIGISDNKIILFDRIYRTNGSEVHKKIMEYSYESAQRRKKRKYKKKQKTLFETKVLEPKKAGRPKVSRVKCFERTKAIIDTESAKLGLSELHFIEKIVGIYINYSDTSVQEQADKKRVIISIPEIPEAVQKKLKQLETKPKLKKLTENLFEKNGYACPKCDNELYDSSNLIVNGQKQIHCDCGFVGHRKV